MSAPATAPELIDFDDGEDARRRRDEIAADIVATAKESPFGGGAEIWRTVIQYERHRLRVELDRAVSQVRLGIDFASRINRDQLRNIAQRRDDLLALKYIEELIEREGVMPPWLP